MTEASNNNSALAKLLNQLNVPTLAAILLMGGGNFFQGVQSSAANHEEIERAIREVHQLYGKIDQHEDRQLKALRNQEEILRLLQQAQNK